jgi:hypothetical protein
MSVTMSGPDPRDEDPEAIKAAKEARPVEELLDALWTSIRTPRPKTPPSEDGPSKEDSMASRNENIERQIQRL